MTPENDITDEQTIVKQFNADRLAALSSMDRDTIERHYAKYYSFRLSASLRRNCPEWTEDAITECFWGAVHKAITGDAAFPRELRMKSKAWLNARGYLSYDDGDL